MRKDLIGVSVYNLMILLYNVYLGAQTKGVGFEDSDKTLKSFTRALNNRIYKPMSVIESALWSCNLLDEKKKFWHPNGYSFDQFLNMMLDSKLTFNKEYNWIEEKKCYKKSAAGK